jgi:hypothetical protein
LQTRDTADLRALAETADELYDLHLPTSVSQVNPCLVSLQDAPVLAAVYGGHNRSSVARGPAASGLAASTIAARSPAARVHLDSFLRSSTS